MISFNQKPRKTHLEVLARFLVSSEGTGPLLLTVRDRLLTGLCRGLYFKIFVLMPLESHYLIVLIRMPLTYHYLICSFSSSVYLQSCAAH